MSKTVLYYRPGACALAPHIALHWAGLDHEARIGNSEDPAFREVSPSGTVPVLITPDGTVLSQAGALLSHIARTANRRDLLGEVCRTVKWRCGAAFSAQTSIRRSGRTSPLRGSRPLAADRRSVNMGVCFLGERSCRA